MSLIRLYNRDCMEAMAEMPDKAYHLAIVDPPYGIGVAKKTSYGRRTISLSIHSKTKKSFIVKRSDYKPKSWDNSKPPQEYFSELMRVSRNQIIWGVDHFNLQNVKSGRIKWNKCVADGVSFKKYEHAFCSLINGEKEFIYLWSGMLQGLSLQDPETQKGNKKLNEIRIHPTQKPVILYLWLLKNYAKPGDKILDTHGGSMSIAIACDIMGFDLDLYEIDKEYFEAGKARLERHQRQGVLDL